MLITRSTPRITYRIGMRAGLAILKDKSLPSLLVGADGEVDAGFKFWNLNFNGELGGSAENTGQRTLPKYHANRALDADLAGKTDVRRRPSDLKIKSLGLKAK